MNFLLIPNNQSRSEMESFQWNKCAISHSTAADFNQSQLLDKVQQLQAAISQKNDPTQIIPLINDLKYQVVLYFSQKERQMLHSQNKAYHHHRQAHDRFIWRVTDLQSEFTSKHYSQILDLCNELQKWVSRLGSSLEQEKCENPFNLINHDPTISG